jgi:hypothetical protein
VKVVKKIGVKNRAAIAAANGTMSSAAGTRQRLIRFVAGAGLARSEKQGRGCAVSELDSKRAMKTGTFG